MAGALPLAVFISHSVGKEENAVVKALSASLSGAGVPNYLAMHDRQLGVRLSEKVKAHIGDSHVLIAVLTRKGDKSSWVRDEIGYAMGKGLRAVALLERGLNLDGMHDGAEYISFDPTDPGAEIVTLSERLVRQRAEQDAEHARAEATEAQDRPDAVEVFAVTVLCIALVAIAVLAARK